MPPFITDRADFNATEAVIDSVFHRAKRLPSFVFRVPTQELSFFEFDLVFSDAFWEVLQSLAGQSGDERLCLSVVDPNPETYYSKHFGFFGALELPSTSDASAYWNAMSYEPPTSPADALVTNGRVLAITVPSGRFGIWCERNLELGVLGIINDQQSREPLQLPGGFPWKTLSESLDLIRPSFVGGTVPEEIRRGLISAYTL